MQAAWQPSRAQCSSAPPPPPTDPPHLCLPSLAEPCCHAGFPGRVCQNHVVSLRVALPCPHEDVFVVQGVARKLHQRSCCRGRLGPADDCRQRCCAQELPPAAAGNTLGLDTCSAHGWLFGGVPAGGTRGACTSADASNQLMRAIELSIEVDFRQCDRLHGRLVLVGTVLAVDQFWNCNCVQTLAMAPLL